MNQRNTQKTYIEFLRITAAFLVIVNHTNSDLFLARTPSLTWLCSLTYFFICKTAVPIFLFIMGALLLGKEDTPQKTRSRLLRMVTVLVVGSVFYYIYYAQRYNREMTVKKFLFDFPKVQTTNAFWYLYLYLGLLCMLPILQKLARALDKGQMRYLLIITLGVAGTVPLLAVFFPDVGLSIYFTAGLIGPYIGQVLLGYYLEEYVPMKKGVFWGALLSFVLLIAFQVGGTYLLYQENPASYLGLDNRTMITVTAASAALYICVKYLFVRFPPRPWLTKAICRLGRLTFGVYLLSDLIIDLSKPMYTTLTLTGNIHPMVTMVLWEGLIFAVGALVTAILRIFPFLRKWL